MQNLTTSTPAARLVEKILADEHGTWRRNSTPRLLVAREHAIARDRWDAVDSIDAELVLRADEAAAGAWEVDR